MAYQVNIEKFQGPLDLLLQLIEQKELAITDIALADITEAYIQQLAQVEERFPEELADFLVIAAKLLYLKSRALLPYLTPVDDEATQQLAQQLRMYKEYRDASNVLAEQLAAGNFAFGRPVAAERLLTKEFSPPPSLTSAVLAKAFAAVLDRVETVIRLPIIAIRKAVTLKDKITALYALLQQREKITFRDLIAQQSDRTDLVVTFLAVLELVKQNTVLVQQEQCYSDIIITRAQI